MNKIAELLKSGNAAVVDVRTPAEFMGGHVSGSVNIPLNELPVRMSEIKAMGKDIILCCASGMRSGNAAAYLQQQGIPCLNGGPWTDVNYYANNN